MTDGTLYSFSDSDSSDTAGRQHRVLTCPGKVRKRLIGLAQAPVVSANVAGRDVHFSTVFEVLGRTRVRAPTLARFQTHADRLLQGKFRIHTYPLTGLATYSRISAQGLAHERTHAVVILSSTLH